MSDHICITNSNKEGGFQKKMQDLKTYLSEAPIVSIIWFGFGFLAGLLIKINRLFPDALIFPFFFFSF